MGWHYEVAADTVAKQYSREHYRLFVKSVFIDLVRQVNGLYAADTDFGNRYKRAIKKVLSKFDSDEEHKEMYRHAILAYGREVQLERRRRRALRTMTRWRQGTKILKTELRSVPKGTQLMLDVYN